MGLFVIWGTSFEIEETTLATGGVGSTVVGVDGGWDGISATSMQRMMDLAATHGVNEELWPYYDEEELPRGPDAWTDVRAKSDELRRALETLPDDVIAADYWLNFLVPRVRAGHSLFFHINPDF